MDPESSDRIKQLQNKFSALYYDYLSDIMFTATQCFPAGYKIATSETAIVFYDNTKVQEIYVNEVLRCLHRTPQKIASDLSGKPAILNKKEYIAEFKELYKLYKVLLRDVARMHIHHYAVRNKDSRRFKFSYFGLEERIKEDIHTNEDLFNVEIVTQAVKDLWTCKHIEDLDLQTMLDDVDKVFNGEYLHCTEHGIFFGGEQDVYVADSEITDAFLNEIKKRKRAQI